MQEMLSLISAWALHLDVHLAELVAVHGEWVDLILFAVIFVETGVVVMPFLPGDSLLFIAAALAAKGLFVMGIVVLSVLPAVASVGRR